jgi:hypothetical protein
MTAAIEWLLRVNYIVEHCSLEWDILSHIESKRPIRSMQVGQRCAQLLLPSPSWAIP